MEEIIKLILLYIKGLSWLVIFAGVAYILYSRAKAKVISLRDITIWANQNKGIGVSMLVSKLSAMSNDARKQAQREIGFKKVLNGYKDETSFVVTILDDANKIISSRYFLGTEIDEELKIALGNNAGINIKLR